MGDFRITNGLRPLSGARRMRERRGKMTVSSRRDEIICWSSSLTGVGRLIVAIVLLVAVLPADAQMAGEMVSVLGKVEVLREGRWQALNTGGALKAGEVVQTGEGSRIAIQFANGPQLKLNANSRLELKEIEGLAPASTSAAQIILRLITGEMRVKGNGNPLEVQTLPATAIIRGTEYNLAIVPPDSARLAVLAGLVEFANPQGSVLVAANEQATVKLGEAPRKTVLLNPLDAVQWSLYYPDLDAGRAERERAARADPRSPRHWTEAARGHLLRGQVPDAHRALDRALMLDPNDARAYSLRAVIELVQNRKADARADAERAVAADPAAPEAHLALSWVQQAEFDLDGALTSARRAVELAPDDPHALIQESRLLFGLGRVKEAFKVAEKARQRAPQDAVVNATWGFLQLARNRNSEAIAAFEYAIAQDSTRGEPHLGLGIALFQRNRTDAAVEEMRKATLLEPSVSLYNSYLGKAYYEVKQDRQAEKYLALAKQLDPLDPTPHFYDAIRRQSVNRPVEAVRDLQKSIELNDNRAVYRSRLLLDEDLAARDATLGRIYNEVGFEQLGLREGWKSLASDPANYSAHRLLADSYLALPRHEIARVSELLQSQLLQPISITPVQPRLAESLLPVLAGAGSATPSLNEFNSLFTRDRLTLLSSGIVGSNNTFGDEVVLSGIKDSFSYSVGQFHYQSDGFRENNDLRQDVYNFFVQSSISPMLNLQAEIRRREVEHGDLKFKFDLNKSFDSDYRRNLITDTIRLGAHYIIDPHSDAIISIIRQNEVEDQVLFSDANSKADSKAKTQGYLIEGQLLFHRPFLNAVTGGSYYNADNNVKLSLLEFGESISESESGETSQSNGYLYLYLRYPTGLLWTFGISVDALDDEPLGRFNQVNPKFGLIWNLTPDTMLRFASFRTFKRPLLTDQTIEPTQVAGFNQFFDDSAAADSWRYGIALDHRFSSNLYAGGEISKREIDVPVEGAAPEDWKEQIFLTYVNWKPYPELVASVGYELEYFENSDNYDPPDTTTHLATLALRYFNPSGFFSYFGATYIDQSVTLDDNKLTENKRHDCFFLFDVSGGYRLPKRYGVVQIGVKNIFDENFQYQGLGIRTGQQELQQPPFFPERTVYAQLNLNFD